MMSLTVSQAFQPSPEKAVRRPCQDDDDPGESEPEVVAGGEQRPVGDIH